MFTRTSALVDQLIQKYESRLGVKVEANFESIKVPHEEVKALQETVLHSQINEKKPAEVQEKAKEETKLEAHPPASKPEAGHHEEVKVDMSKAPYDLFPQIDIRVGNIVDCWKHPSSENLYCEKIDVGEEQVREIGSGLQQHVPLADMAGLVLVMANLKPRKLAGFNSNGMVMALHGHDGISLVRPDGALAGERVGLEGVLEAPGKSKILPALNPKKKILESCIAYFGTDSEGFACFGLKRLLTSAGFIKTLHPNARIS